MMILQPRVTRIVSDAIGLKDICAICGYFPFFSGLPVSGV